MLWEKLVFGVLYLLIVLVLLVGPLWLFSNAINSFLDSNPVSQAGFHVSLLIKGVTDASPYVYSLMASNNAEKVTNDLSRREYDDLLFQDIDYIREYGPDQTQFVIMSQPVDIWLMINKQRDIISQTLQKAVE